MDEKDIPLPFPNPDGSVADAQTVKELVAECEERTKNLAMKYWSQAQYNERMTVGDQKGILSATWQFVDDSSWPADIPFNSRNYLRNLQLTWSSRILEDRPSLKCYPSEPGVDMIRADMCDKILDYVRQNQDWDDLCFAAANLVQIHSCVGIKTVWDPLWGPPSQGIPVFNEMGIPEIDPETGLQVRERVGEPLGDVRWEVVSIFDYGTDGSENIEDSKWVYFTKFIDKFDAEQLLRAQGIEEKIECTKYEDNWGTEREGVKVTELWWRPDYRFPQGVYAVTIGDYALSAQPFPYTHKELPIAVWKCGPRRGSPYGSTHVDDAVYIQRTVNEITGAMSRQARQIRDTKLLGPSSVIDAIEDGNHMIKVDSIEQSNAVRYLETPDMARVLVTSLEDNVKALFAIFGLNEMLTGADNVKSGTAAKSIAYLNKLDSMKMAGASRSLSKAILRTMRQTLKLYQQYVKAPRIAHITGNNNLYNPLLFTSADISGVDVRLEPISGFSNMRATMVENAQTQMQTMGPTPELQSQAKTGLPQTAFDKAQREMVQAEIQSILQGQPVEPDQSIDANIAVDEIMGIMSNYRGTQFEPALRQLLMTYMQAAQSQQADPNMQQEGNEVNGQ